MWRDFSIENILCQRISWFLLFEKPADVLGCVQYLTNHWNGQFEVIFTSNSIISLKNHNIFTSNKIECKFQLFSNV